MIAVNPFVYEQTYKADIRSSAIPALLQEHYAQCAEDLILIALYQALVEKGHVPDAMGGYCLEIGANHGFSGNNTVLFEKYFGSQCILVEANPDLLDDLRKSRPQSTVIHAAVVDTQVDHVDLSICNHHEISSLNRDFVERWHDGSVGLRDLISVPAVRINEILEEYIPENQRINYLSIDVEGYDLRIVKDIDFSRWRPIFVQMEPSEHYTPGESQNMRFYMETQGYALVAKTNVNLLFLDKVLLLQDGGNAEEAQAFSASVIQHNARIAAIRELEIQVQMRDEELAALKNELDLLKKNDMPQLQQALHSVEAKMKEYDSGFFISADSRLGKIAKALKTLLKF